LDHQATWACSAAGTGITPTRFAVATNGNRSTGPFIATAVSASRRSPTAHRIPWESGFPQRTTPSSRPPSGFVTITHPHHPLRGQRVEIVRFRRGNDPDLIVVLPDGRHTAIALSSTDYGSDPEIPPTVTAEHLLDLDGLRRVIQWLDCLARPEDAVPTTGDRVQTRQSEPR
jgi:Family of unknown function (DUF5372)